jgi:hypothetical protein
LFTHQGIPRRIQHAVQEWKIIESQDYSNTKSAASLSAAQAEAIRVRVRSAMRDALTELDEEEEKVAGDVGACASAASSTGTTAGAVYDYTNCLPAAAATVSDSSISHHHQHHASYSSASTSVMAGAIVSDCEPGSDHSAHSSSAPSSSSQLLASNDVSSAIIEIVRNFAMGLKSNVHSFDIGPLIEKIFFRVYSSHISDSINSGNLLNSENTHTLYITILRDLQSAYQVLIEQQKLERDEYIRKEQQAALQWKIKQQNQNNMICPFPSAGLAGADIAAISTHALDQQHAMVQSGLQVTIQFLERDENLFMSMFLQPFLSRGSIQTGANLNLSSLAVALPSSAPAAVSSEVAMEFPPLTPIQPQHFQMHSNLYPPSADNAWQHACRGQIVDFCRWTSLQKTLQECFKMGTVCKSCQTSPSYNGIAGISAANDQQSPYQALTIPPLKSSISSRSNMSVSFVRQHIARALNDRGLTSFAPKLVQQHNGEALVSRAAFIAWWPWFNSALKAINHALDVWELQVARIEANADPATV